MRLSIKSINPVYFYVLSLIIVIALYTKVNVEVATLFIVSAGLSMYVLQCQSKAILVSLLIVGLYMMGMNVVREGMSAADKTKAAKASAATQSKQKNKKL